MFCLFTNINNIKTLLWFIELLDIHRTDIINLKGLQLSYMSGNLYVAKQLNKIYQFTKEERYIYCKLVTWLYFPIRPPSYMDHNITIMKKTIDPLSNKFKRVKEARKLLRELNCDGDCYWEVDI